MLQAPTGGGGRATVTVTDAGAPAPPALRATTVKVVVSTTSPEMVLIAVVGVELANPPVQLKTEGVPPLAQLAARVTAPPPIGNDGGFAANEHELGGASGATPVPVSPMLRGLPVALLLILTLAVLVPVAVGLNVMLKAQVAFGANVALLQVFVATE